VKSGISANQLWTQVPLANRTVSLGAGAAGTLKSIQRGTCSITGTNATNDATLSPAVVTANTQLAYLGQAQDIADSGWGTKYRLRLSIQSTTAVRATRDDAGNIGTIVATINWQVTEWY